ncbi:PREDICTED: uncharacterized protein LOC107337581 [Acropora digitifera]|uniref:uncharacterized protein LOC107337581 n=1 Tax=Acropora digitifera TaxID=70779 RepID=UPI00077A3765|nr:PREDICTED: uncharacterized protein LOC107337581 [Acropora digitifera]
MLPEKCLNFDWLRSIDWQSLPFAHVYNPLVSLKWRRWRQKHRKKNTIVWIDEDVGLPLDVFVEETIEIGLEKVKCPKDKIAVYVEVQKKLEQHGIIKIVAAIKEKLKRCEGWCPEEGKFEEALEVHAIIFKCNPTIDPPHLWHSSSSDHYRELDNESSLENETGTSDNSSELNSEKGSDLVPDDNSSERKRSKYITGATPKFSKKTKLEISIETVCLSLRESSEAEMKR